MDLLAVQETLNSLLQHEVMGPDAMILVFCCPFSSCPQFSPESETLMLGKIEGRRRREQQRTRCLDDITNSTDMNLSRLQDIVKDRRAWSAEVHGVTKNWTQLSDRTRTSCAGHRGNDERGTGKTSASSQVLARLWSAFSPPHHPLCSAEVITLDQ